MKAEKQTKRIKPDWLKTQIPTGKTYLGVREIVEKTNFIQFARAEIAQT